MNLDVKNRIIKAFIELVASIPAVVSIAGTRIYKSGDASHKAEYPSVTVDVPSCFPFDARQGWYRATVNLVSNVHAMDDKPLDVRDQLQGLLVGIVQNGRIELDLNATATARTDATALTVVEAEMVDLFEEDEGNVRSAGVSVYVTARPSTGKNKG